MEESTIELGTMILERHRSTYQVRLEGMRPHEIQAAAAILRFVTSIERRWMLAATETASIPLLLQINGSPAARQSRAIVTGQPLDEGQQGSNPGDIPIEHASARGPSSDLGHTAGASAAEGPGHRSESNATAPPAAVSETANAEPSGSASSALPAMTDRAPQPIAATASAATSQTVTPAGSAAAGSHEQAQHATSAPAPASAAGTPQPHAAAAETKPQKSELDPDTVLSGAALIWTKPPTEAQATAAKQAAVEAVEATLPHPHPTPVAATPKQVVTGANAPAAHPPAMEHPAPATSAATSPHTSAASASAPRPGVDHQQQSSVPQKAAPVADPAKEAAKKAEADKAAKEYEESTVHGELLFHSPPPELVLHAPAPVPQAPAHTPGPAQPPQSAPAHAETAGISHGVAQGVAEHGTTTATPTESSHVDFDVLRAQILRAFARDIALEAERRGVETWDR